MADDLLDESGDEGAGELPPSFSWTVSGQGKSQQQRVVGWRAGMSLASPDVKEILSTDRRARHEYKGLRTATAQKKSQEGGDPLAGLPPTWQAFWSTVPHLDPQAAFKQYRKGQQKTQGQGQSQGQGLGQGLGQAVDPQKSVELLEEVEELEGETRALEAEMRRRRQELAEKEKLSREWDRKLERVRVLDRDEGELSRRVLRRLEGASYEYGIVEGKLRSSDIYFHFLREDGRLAHQKKMATLQRSHALMGKQTDALKAEVLQLLRTAMEAQPPSSDPPPSSSERRRSGGGSGGSAAGEGPPSAGAGTD